MTIFLASLAGIPPLGGWYAKFGAFKAALDAGGGWGYSIAVIAAVNAVIATAYYITVMREMWMKPVPDGDVTPIKVPASLQAALGHLRRRHARARCAARPDRQVGDLTDLAGALRPDPRPSSTSWRPRSSRSAARCGSTSTCRSRCTASTASTRRRARPAAAATSSPRPRSVRCSVPCSRAGSMPSSRGSASPTTSRSSRSVPGRARWPARMLLAAPQWPGRYVAVEVSAAQRATAPGRRACRRRRMPASAVHGRGHRQRAARQPAVPPARCSTAAGVRRPSTVAADGTLQRASGAGAGGRGRGCRPRAPHGARVPCSRPRREWVDDAAVA